MSILRFNTAKCSIEQKDNYKVLRTNDNEILRLPITLTDDEIWSILNVINENYSAGYEDGQSSKIKEIRKALEI